MESQYDSHLLTIAQGLSRDGGGVESILEVYFSFLRRKTDFFNVEKSRVESVVLGACQKQWEIHARSEAEKKTKAERMAREKTARETPKASLPSFQGKVTPSGGGAVAGVSSSEEVGIGGGEEKRPVAKGVETGVAGSLATPNAGNGGATDRYTWKQTLSEMTIEFPLPDSVKSKDVTVKYANGRLKVVLAGSPPLLDTALSKRILPDTLEWLVDSDSSGKSLSVVFNKENSMEWWNSVGEGEPSIDIQKVEPENSKLGDLDGETRKTVEKMMFDQAQKAKGLPSSDELQKQEILQRFMKSHPE